jgi:hypothetical protein
VAIVADDRAPDKATHDRVTTSRSLSPGVDILVVAYVFAMRTYRRKIGGRLSPHRATCATVARSVDGCRHIARPALPSADGQWIVPMTRRRIGRTLVALAVAIGVFLVFELGYERTDAFRRGNRIYYRDGRATWAGIAFARFWTLLSGIGLTPPFLVSLETIGSQSGRRRAVPMVVAAYDGHDYLVAMLGERSPWVHNVRAAGGQAWLRRGRLRAVHLVEVPVSERAPIIRAYLRLAAGARPHIPVATDAPPEAFEAVASTHPVFRIDFA